MTTLNLNELAGKLLQSFIPAAARRHNLLVNDVPSDIYIDTDRDLAASVLSGLLQPLVVHATNTSIRISAKIFDTLILLDVTDGSGYVNCGVVEGLRRSDQVYQHQSAA
jgi:hypothetical protein